MCSDVHLRVHVHVFKNYGFRIIKTLKRPGFDHINVRTNLVVSVRTFTANKLMSCV